MLRRLDCVLEATKPAVLGEFATRQKAGVNPEPFLLRKSGQLFFNTSPLDMKKLMGDQDNIRENLFAYVQGFSPAVRNIFESFEFHIQIDRLAKAGLLYLVAEKFARIDLHPNRSTLVLKRDRPIILGWRRRAGCVYASFRQLCGTLDARIASGGDWRFARAWLISQLTA